jgi:hypothetical protein
VKRELSALEQQAADALRRARRLPVGADRNDLRQLATGLLWLHRNGMDALTRQRLEDDFDGGSIDPGGDSQATLHKNRSLTVGLIDRRLIALGITGLAHLNATSNLQCPYYPNDPTPSPLDRLGPAKRPVAGTNRPV